MTRTINSSCFVNIIALVLGSCAFLSIVEPVKGGVIYSQVTPADPTGAFSSLDLPGYQKIADNFLVGDIDPFTVRSLRFIGGVTGEDASSPPSDDFRVVFHADNGGVPGTPILGGDYAIGPALRRTPTGAQLLNGITEPLEYLINLPQGIALNPGTEYWVSITNDLLPTHGWVWARANGFLDQDIATTNADITIGPWAVGTGGGMYFELNDQRIPEPTSLQVLLIGLATVAFKFCARSLR